MVPRVAAIIAAVLALVATVVAAVSVPVALPDAVVSELWRTVGHATLVALFVLFALRPRRFAIWAIALGSKLALVIVGLIVGFECPGAADLVLWDGILSLVLAVGTLVSARLRAIGCTVPPACSRSERCSASRGHAKLFPSEDAPWGVETRECPCKTTR